MIVGLDLEGAGPAVADVDDAGVLAGALDDELAAGGQSLQMHARGFVGAVFAPHHAINAKLGHGGLAALPLQDALIFFRGEAVFADDFGSNGGLLYRLSSG